jgi:O-acetyl-ADP-ribose deacetylase (regulator of RNase III)
MTTPPITATVTFHVGDMFASGARSLVDPVNCVGTNGAGLAKAFARRFPDAVATYTRQAKHGGVVVGETSCCWSLARVEKDPGGRATLIYFFPTKQDWRDPSRIEWIRDGLADLTKRVVANAPTVPSIAIPALGCGFGWLAWEDVRPLLLEAGEEMARGGVRVMVYGPKEIR